MKGLKGRVSKGNSTRREAHLAPEREGCLEPDRHLQGQVGGWVLLTSFLLPLKQDKGNERKLQQEIKVRREGKPPS